MMPRPARFDRQAALDSAVELFWSKGYYASSMKDIEKALDMRPGSLYATFGNKSGLFAEALAAYAARSADDFRQVLEGSPGIVDGLQGYLRSLAQTCSGTAPARACMLIKTLLEVNAEDAALLVHVEAMLAAFELRLAEALKSARGAGELRAEVDCPRLARLLQAQIMGLRSFAERGVPCTQVAELAEDMASMLDAYRTQ
jgi:AcrR family transcriptional regulator